MKLNIHLITNFENLVKEIAWFLFVIEEIEVYGKEKGRVSLARTCGSNGKFPEKRLILVTDMVTRVAGRVLLRLDPCVVVSLFKLKQK